MSNSTTNKISKILGLSAISASLALGAVPQAAFAQDYSRNFTSQPYVITADEFHQVRGGVNESDLYGHVDTMSMKQLRRAQRKAQQRADWLAARINERKAQRTSNRQQRKSGGISGTDAAIIAGILGITAGAIIAGKNKKKRKNSQVYIDRKPLAKIQTNRGDLRVAQGNWIGSRAWLNHCRKKYRSFNPRTGKFLSYSGEYKLCR